MKNNTKQVLSKAIQSIQESQDTFLIEVEQLKKERLLSYQDSQKFEAQAEATKDALLRAAQNNQLSEDIQGVLIGALADDYSTSLAELIDQALLREGRDKLILYHLGKADSEIVERLNTIQATDFSMSKVLEIVLEYMHLEKHTIAEQNSKKKLFRKPPSIQSLTELYAKNVASFAKQVIKKEKEEPLQGLPSSSGKE